MKQITFAAIGALIILTLAYCTQDSPQNTDNSQAAISSAEMVKRGEYLVTIGGCNDCHSPKISGEIPDPDRLLSGHPADEKLPLISDKKMIAPGQWALCSSGLTAWVGPWGTSFAANLTPDDTGIGNWTEAQFFKAIREGKLKGLDGTRTLLPPMPWFNFAKMSDEDLRAVFVYLKSLKPVKNVVPNPLPPTT